MADHLSRIKSGELEKGVADQLLDASLFMVHIQPKEDWRSSFMEYIPVEDYSHQK